MDLHNKTRDIYHKQHTRIVNDDKTMNRIENLYPEEYFGLEKNWFNGKKAADLGCGDMIVLSIRMAQFGAKQIFSMDLGKEWMDNAKKQIKKYAIRPETITLVDGNVLDVPLDCSFDFVACNGVLCHLNNMSEVEKGFSEGARICKPGGFFYSSYTIDGGLMENAIYPAIQKYYLENEDFRQFIDNISPKDFEYIYNQINMGLLKHEGVGLQSPFNKELYDEDLCVTIQNYVQGPNRFDLDCSHDHIKSLYEKYGFEDITPLKRYVKIDNIRKYLSPLKYDRESQISKILWGNGSVEYIARKKK